MVVSTVTGGSWGGDAVWPWFVAIGHGDLTQTLLTLAGLGHGWLALTPFVAALGCTLVALAKATPRPPVRMRDAEIAFAAFAAWLLLSGVGPVLLARYTYSTDVSMILLLVAAGIVIWRTVGHGRSALLAAVPLLALLAPSLAESANAVSLAAGSALVLSGLLMTPWRSWKAGGA